MFDQPTPRARGEALAGYLAERGIVTLDLVGAGGRRTLRARVTDLPGELLRAAPCRVECGVGAFVVTPEAICPAPDAPTP